MPIFGTAGRLNDNYVNDLRNGLTAVIDELDRIGLIDDREPTANLRGWSD